MHKQTHAHYPAFTPHQHTHTHTHTHTHVHTQSRHRNARADADAQVRRRRRSRARRRKHSCGTEVDCRRKASARHRRRQADTDSLHRTRAAPNRVAPPRPCRRREAGRHGAQRPAGLAGIRRGGERCVRLQEGWEEFITLAASARRSYGACSQRARMEATRQPLRRMR